MRNLQAATLTILRKAEFSGDLPTALAAAWQAQANIALLASLTKQPPATVQFQTSSPIFSLAFTDGAMRAVRAYWIEGKELHCITMEGKHEQLSADLLDRDFTQELNRQ